MINILIPMGGKSSFFKDEISQYPKPLIEVNGKPMIELVIERLSKIELPKNFIFVVNSDDCHKYHLDKVLKLLAGKNCVVIKLAGETKGAVCSALMAIEHINNHDELIIVNADSIIEHDLNRVISFFHMSQADAGVISFPSVHPKWSYVRLDQNRRIVESAEKMPISTEAVAGFYYFSKGTHFVDAAIRSIEKEASVNDIYYIAPVFNELVLKNLNLLCYKIPKSQYHSFYSPQKIKEYERSHSIQNAGRDENES